MGRMRRVVSTSKPGGAAGPLICVEPHGVVEHSLAIYIIAELNSELKIERVECLVFTTHINNAIIVSPFHVTYYHYPIATQVFK